MSDLTIGYAAMLEQFGPQEAVGLTALAEQNGFSGCMAADHFQPWVPAQGQASFVWNVLTAVGERTAGDLGPGVTCPSFRFHPAIVAQAAATLAELFPGRLSVALGTGEFSNEHITGDPWPGKETRNARLRECVDVIRALFAGEVVDHDGLVRVDRAKLWTLPPEPPPLLATAVSVETAGWASEWADGLITINQPHEHLRRMLDAFGGPASLQVHLSWAPSEEEALRVAHDQWRTNVFPPPLCWDLATVEQFDQAAGHVRPEDLHGPVLISSDLARHAEWINEYAELGFDAIYLHHVGKEQRAFIEAFGEHVLPRL